MRRRGVKVETHWEEVPEGEGQEPIEWTLQWYVPSGAPSWEVEFQGMRAKGQAPLDYLDGVDRIVSSVSEGERSKLWDRLEQEAADAAVQARFDNEMYKRENRRPSDD